MSKNWNRKIQVVLDTRTLSSDDFDISFNYSFTSDNEPNEVEVEIKNLSQSTINTYINKDKQLIINAGYEGDIGNIMKGFIIDVASGWANTDKNTQIMGFDSSDAYLNKFISKAYVPGTTALQIINDLCGMAGLAIGEVSLFNNAQYVRGRSVTGKLQDILTEIVKVDCKTNIQIKAGTIIIRNVEQGVETGFILSGETGLIGSPEPMGDVSDIPADLRPSYIVRCLLNHKIGPSSRIRIDSKVLKADAVVINGKHMGSMTGAFETYMEVKLI